MAEQKAQEVLPRALASPANKFEAELRATAKAIAAPGKGILAADESTGTIGNRLAGINVANNEVNRLRYRELLFSTKGWGQYCSGVILYDETIRQKASTGVTFVKMIQDAGVIPGIKVDLGARALPFCEGDTYTQGLTDLDKRCAEYYTMGARFAKWRAVLKIQNGYVSQTSILENAWTLARYAAICQANGLCPIVEPELLMDGTHSLEVCKYWTEKILGACYKALNDQEVILEGSLLKPNMCLPGKEYTGKVSFDANAKATVECMRRTVPAAVPGIVFLSGGQAEEEATNNLNELNKQPGLPWSLSFSYGRALQKSVLQAWKGSDKLLKAGQDALMMRAKANSMAQLGKYDGFAATEESKKSLYQKGYVY